MKTKKIVKAALIAACTIAGIAAIWIIPAMVAEEGMKDVWVEREENQ